jgi:hypothetical protein
VIEHDPEVDGVPEPEPAVGPEAEVEPVAKEAAAEA